MRRSAESRCRCSSQGLLYYSAKGAKCKSLGHRPRKGLSSSRPEALKARNISESERKYASIPQTHQRQARFLSSHCLLFTAFFRLFAVCLLITHNSSLITHNSSLITHNSSLGFPLSPLPSYPSVPCCNVLSANSAGSAVVFHPLTRWLRKIISLGWRLRKA